MTIGAFGHDYSKAPNPDFIKLMEVHKEICQENQLNEADLEVSMGMSDDFEKAVSHRKLKRSVGARPKIRRKYLKSMPQEI